MQAVRILNGLTLLLLCNNMLFYSIAADSLHQMSILLSYAGWRDLDPLEIVEDGVPCKVESLLSDPVTAENVDGKIRQAHHFLSCQYAIVFLSYKEYLFNLGRKCLPMDKFDQRQCLNMLKQIIDPKILVSQMQNSLTFFDSIRQPQTALINDVFDILTRFSKQFKSISFLKNDDDVSEYIETEEYLWYIEGFLRDLEKITYTFFQNHCGPKWYLKERTFGSSTYSWVKDVLTEVRINNSSYVDCMNKIYTLANYFIKCFLISDYTRLGFVPDNSELSASILNEKLDLESRVQLADKIPRYDGWSLYLNHLRIIVNSRQYGINDLRAIETNEENIDRKIRHVYQLISCYYFELLAKLLLYNKSISQFFDSGSNEDKFVFLRSFVQTIKKSDPVVMQMKDTLLSFQRLFPQTSFDKYILNLLDFFKNSTDMINFYQRDFYDENDNGVDYLYDRLLIQINILLYKLTEIEIKVIHYNLKFCRVPGKLNQYVVPENSPTDMEKQIDEIITSFLNVVVPSLGFMYNPLSSP